MVNGVNTTSATDTSAAGISQTLNTELDQNTFLNLLVTQIQHQDPLNPMEDREFVTQLAQFSSLEQMQQMNAKINAMASGLNSGNLLSLIGHHITANIPGQEKPLEGTVQSVMMDSGSPMLVVDDTYVDPSWITRIDK